uniref:Fatty acid binding protein 6 n=1 Tax=Scophthalmus maximus TaxID=52904 RepID=A0A8D3CQI7_SCOMX
MAFTGKYELESQENYEEFLDTLGLLNAKTDHKVVTEVVQDGHHFTWTQSIPKWTWSNTFTIGQECELVTMKSSKFKATVTMDGGKVVIPFPQYHFTAEINGDKLVMTCITPGEKGVTFKRVSKRTDWTGDLSIHSCTAFMSNRRVSYRSALTSHGGSTFLSSICSNIL